MILTKKEEEYFNYMLRLFYLYSTNQIDDINSSLDKIYNELDNKESYEHIINALNNSGFISVNLEPAYMVHEPPELNYTGNLTEEGIKYLKEIYSI